MQAESFPATSLVRRKIFPIKRHLFTPGKSWPRIMIILGVLGLTLMLLAPAWAADGALDPTFDPGAGVGNSPMLWGRTNYTDPSGKMMITGSFRQVAGGTRTCLARLLRRRQPGFQLQAAITNESNSK